MSDLNVVDAPYYPLLTNERNILIGLGKKNTELASVVNTERATAFMKSLGFQNLPEIIFVTEDDYPVLRETLLETGHLKPNFFAAGDNEICAQFLPLFHVVLIKCTGQVRAQTSPLEIESLVVHECAHATSTWPMFEEQTEDHVSLSRPRQGFALTDQYGSFLEEGFAEYVAQQYRSAHIDDEEIVEMFSHIPNMPSNTDMDRRKRLYEAVAIPITFGEINIRLPIKYIPKSGQVVPSSYAAYGIELLVSRIPNLGGLLIKARYDTTALRNAIQLIDAYMSQRGKSYADIARVIHRSEQAYNQEDFITKLDMIMNNPLV